MSNDTAELRLLSKTVAAKVLGIGKEKLNLLLETGKIRFLYFDEKVRIPMMEIKRFIKANLTSLPTLEESKKVIFTGKTQIKNQFDSTNFFNQLIEGENYG